jgi:hypothetical protein
MKSRGIRGHRPRAVAVEALEGRALLTTVAPMVQPMGVHVAAVQRAHESSSQGSGANVSDAVSVGKQYSKALLSRSTGTLISNYTKALLRGNGKELRSLNSSNAALQLDASFKNVAHSSEAHAINQSLNRFGNSVSHQFHKIFG